MDKLVLKNKCIFALFNLNGLMIINYGPLTYVCLQLQILS